MRSEDEMTKLFKPANRQDLFDNWPSEWPHKDFHAIQHDVTFEQYRRFAD
jgi:hypothetical protein